jgi:hypothetical protein
LGQRIVKAMAEKLGATVERDLKHRGTKIEVVFPLVPSRTKASSPSMDRADESPVR